MRVTDAMKARAHEAANDWLDPLTDHGRRAVDAALEAALADVPELSLDAAEYRRLWGLCQDSRLAACQRAEAAEARIAELEARIAELEAQLAAKPGPTFYDLDAARAYADKWGALAEAEVALEAKLAGVLKLADVWERTAARWRDSHEHYDRHYDGEEDCDDACNAEAKQVERCAAELRERVQGT